MEDGTLSSLLGSGGLTVQGPEPPRFWIPHGLTVGHGGLTAGLGGLTQVCGGLIAHTPEPREKLSPDGRTEKSRGRTAGRLPETRRTATNFPHGNLLIQNPILSSSLPNHMKIEP